MYEYKSERVAPAQQNNLVNTYAAFGWELMSAQETYHENTEITGVHTARVCRDLPVTTEK